MIITLTLQKICLKVEWSNDSIAKMFEMIEFYTGT